MLILAIIFFLHALKVVCFLVVEGNVSFVCVCVCLFEFVMTVLIFIPVGPPQCSGLQCYVIFSRLLYILKCLSGCKGLEEIT